MTRGSTFDLVFVPRPAAVQDGVAFAVFATRVSMMVGAMGAGGVWQDQSGKAAASGWVLRYTAGPLRLPPRTRTHVRPYPSLTVAPAADRRRLLHLADHCGSPGGGGAGLGRHAAGERAPAGGACRLVREWKGQGVATKVVQAGVPSACTPPQCTRGALPLLLSCRDELAWEPVSLTQQPGGQHVMGRVSRLPDEPHHAESVHAATWVCKGGEVGQQGWKVAAVSAFSLAGIACLQPAVWLQRKHASYPQSCQLTALVHSVLLLQRRTTTACGSGWAGPICETC